MPDNLLCSLTDKLNQLKDVSLVFAIAVITRFIGAIICPAWIDEAASAIFIAGNSSWSLPIGEWVSVREFLRVLVIDDSSSLTKAMSILSSEDNHPPLYFALAFCFSRLWQADYSLLDPLTTRLPSVIFGSLAAPLLLVTVSFWGFSKRAAFFSGLLMAVSPLSVSMGLEARPYALATTLVCASLLCLSYSCFQSSRGKKTSVAFQFFWVFINVLGVMTHGLFFVSIFAQLVVVFFLKLANKNMSNWLLRILSPLSLSFAISVAYGLVRRFGSAPDQTSWLDLDTSQPLQFLQMPFAAVVTSLTGVLAPGTSITGEWQWPALILSGFATLIGLLGVIKIIQFEKNVPCIFLAFSAAGILGLIGLSVLTLKDFTRALRYGFVYLPGIVAIVGALLGQSWHSHQRKYVFVILACSFICGLGVALGVALPASYNPDLFLEHVYDRSNSPVRLVFNERPVKEGRPVIGYQALSVAWSIEEEIDAAADSQKNKFKPQIALLVGDGNSRSSGIDILDDLKNSPSDVWVVNSYGAIPLPLDGYACQHLEYASAGGYLHDHWRCGLSG